MSAAPHRSPTADVHPISDAKNPYATRIEPGVYVVGFVREQPFRQFGREIWSVTMKVLDDGPA